MLHASQPTRRSLSSFSGAASLIPCSALQAKTWLAWTKQRHQNIAESPVPKASLPSLPENIEEPSSGAPGPILQSGSLNLKVSLHAGTQPGGGCHRRFKGAHLASEGPCKVGASDARTR